MDSMYQVEREMGEVIKSQVGDKTIATVTRPNNTTAYAANTVIGALPFVFEGILDVGDLFMVTATRLRVDAASVPAGMTGFRLHLFDAAPAAFADGAAFNIAAADRSKYLGYINLSGPVDLGDTLWSQDDGVNFSGKLAANSTTLYGILETLSAYTPSASVVKTISLYILGV